jgi:acetylornithine deacetylase/succinyl-diaminopimelate desuccinylase-like protein
MAYGQIYHSGIAVRRLRISTHAEGGHSWLHYGQPSAIHNLVRFAARLTDLKPPESPRTTFNIGLIEGGSSVNTIAASASLTLDMRSEDPAALAILEQAVYDARDPHSSFQIEIVGDRPAGRIARSHPLVQAARDTLEILGTPPLYQAGSTDANYPLACGIPAITIGITHGGNAHRLDEFITTDAIELGLWQLLLLALNVSDGFSP